MVEVSGRRKEKKREKKRGESELRRREEHGEKGEVNELF